MRVVALIAVRNEELYIERCVQHLRENGVDVCIVDNESEDDTAKIVTSLIGKGVFRVEKQAYPGFFDWVALLKRKEQLAAEIKADWFIHQDADEIIEVPGCARRLIDGIGEIDREGYSAVNCNEFVFVPTTESADFERSDYVAGMRHYYFFEPQPTRLIRIWKRQPSVNLHHSGGHGATFPGRIVCPNPFVLRHYIGLSAGYLGRKYARRAFSEHEVHELGWHGWRADIANWRLRLPSQDQMKTYRGDGVWDTSDPKVSHQFVVRRDDAR